jgi:hypothetical protein
MKKKEGDKEAKKQDFDGCFLCSPPEAECQI